MEKEKSIKDCIDGVKDFLKIDKNCENLDEKLQILKDFNFKNLVNNTDMGKCTTSKFDADDTLLARMIYFLIWHENSEKINEIDYSLKGLNNFENIGTNKMYRGDTINTFSNIYGDDDGILTKFGLNAYKDNDFIEKCHTIGNFMLLPGKSDKHVSLNTLKNSCCGDYADLFFNRLYPNGDIIKKYDNTMLLEFVVNINENILPKNYKIFCEKNILNTFCDEKFMPKIIYLHYNKSSFYNFSKMKNTEENKAIYKSFVEQYVKEATYVINCRAERICAILKDRLKH